MGGLPDNMKFKLIEPLRSLFKDEVRNVGSQLGLPEKLLNRHPFPGPGLAVELLEKLQRSESIYFKELIKYLLIFYMKIDYIIKFGKHLLC